MMVRVCPSIEKVYDPMAEALITRKRYFLPEVTLMIARGVAGPPT